MRIKLGNHIMFCTYATKINDSCILITTLNDGEYIVNCETEENAGYCYDKLLSNGWCDFSDYWYNK